MKNVFFIKIIIPAILIIVLFVVSFSVVFIPMVERGLMDRKKEMIKELTNSAWSVIDEYYQEIERGNLTEEAAKAMAINRIEFIRYGDEAKDYFWLTNMVPEMIMHPYRKDLNGKDISDYTDPQGTRLFSEAVKVVRESGDGYIDYYWQWKDDSTRIVPKLSYVRAFEPWEWIVGTGIYIEDVKEDIKAIIGRLIYITLLLVVVISIIIFYIARQSLIIERKRVIAEEELKQERLKYKMLVEASTESTMMWLDGHLHYFNEPIINMTGYSGDELLEKKINELFIVPGKHIEKQLQDIGESLNVEATMLTKTGKEVPVVLNISGIEINNTPGLIIIVKEATRQLIRDKSSQMLQEEIRNSLLLMHLPVKQFVLEPAYINMERTLQDAADLMNRKQADLIFVTNSATEVIGVLHKNAFLQASLNNLNADETKVYQVMRSPVTYINDSALLFEALLLMEKESVDCLPVMSIRRKTLGFIKMHDLLPANHNASLLLIKKIEQAELVDQLQSLNDKLPGILSLMLSSDSCCRNIVQISTAVSDAITRRVIELAVERIGQPPVNFAFIALGSDGRGEQTLKTDQDNAIVYENDSSEDTREYFLSLAELVNTWLNDIGYEYCKGKVMANNPKWTQPVSKWKDYFAEWVENSDPESILDSSIFFDLRYVYGEKSLVNELKDEINRITDAKAVFYKHLAHSVHRTKAVSFSEKQETLDLKKAMLPVVGFARVYALKHNIRETNTIFRLKSIISLGKINQSFIEEIIYSYEYLLFLRFRHQMKSILSNKTPDNLLLLEELKDIEKAAVKSSLFVIAELYTQLGFDFEVRM
ncbi:MAG: DUF294 nucleotidyltransferase-like domain-containing protein [Bacteroidales bacterium]|nr:DUF294 nucleotidyltransferase-like domain-containing protein [Bacteroidales bacterium]